MTTSFQKPELKSDRDNKLLMHVCRNTISTLEVMHRNFFTGLSMDACRKAVKKLCDDGYLVQYPLWDNKSLYRVGPKAVLAFGFPRKRSSKLGPVRLPYEIGCLAYTYMGNVRRKRLLPRELQQRCRAFPESLIHYWAYTWDTIRLSTIRVEPRCGNPRRLIQKFADQLYRYCEFAPLEALHQNDGFQFVVVVASGSQESVLHQANDDLGQPVPLETAHYEELIRFM